MPDVPPIGKQNSKRFQKSGVPRGAAAARARVFRREKEEAEEEMLGGGLEPPCLAAYAPQTYVSAISPPERVESEW
jgi:hypothetical protein